MKPAGDWRILHNALAAYQAAFIRCRHLNIDPHTALLHRDGRNLVQLRAVLERFAQNKALAGSERKRALLRSVRLKLESLSLTADERVSLHHHARWLEEDIAASVSTLPEDDLFARTVLRLYRARDHFTRGVEVYYRAASTHETSLCDCCKDPMRVSAAAIARPALSMLTWLPRALSLLEKEVSASTKPLHALDVNFDLLHDKINTMAMWSDAIDLFMDDIVVLTVVAPFFHKPDARNIAHSARFIYESWYYRRPSEWNEEWLGQGPRTGPWTKWPLPERMRLFDDHTDFSGRVALLGDMGRSVAQRSTARHDWDAFGDDLPFRWCASALLKELCGIYRGRKKPLLRI